MTASGTDPNPQSNDAPQYGQYHEPEYGAMAGAYPAGYDPYVYGRPEPEAAPETPGASGVSGASGAGPSGMPASGAGGGAAGPWPGAAGMPGGDGGWAGTGGGMPSGPTQGGPQGAPGRQPRIINGVDVDDPNRNPLYGRWDPYAVISLVCAMFFAVPVLPAIMGAMAMWRTRTFHMKGFWLGFVAVFLNVFQTILVVWLLINGISVDEYYRQLLNMLVPSGSGSGGDGVVSA